VDLVIDLTLLLAGLVLLVRSADVFVDAAAALSIQWRIPPVVVGAVVIGLGTSAPEVLISTLAAVEGDAALGVGNIIGSNIANLSLVLGVAALLAPVAVASSTLRREAPVSVLAVATFGAAVAIGLPRWSSLVLLGAMAAVVVAATRVRAMAGDEELVEEVLEEVAEQPADPRSRARRPLRALAGLLGTALGAQVVVTGAVGIADETGLSGGFVGLTLVAVGTSLPELVTAVQAARRGQDELVLGNVLGSNIFNSLLAGGLVVLIEPGPLDDRSLATRGVAVMVAVSILAWVLMERRRRIGRLAAGTLLAGYGVAVAVTG
jgi:cation:H+ antiporter